MSCPVYTVTGMMSCPVYTVTGDDVMSCLYCDRVVCYVLCLYTVTGDDVMSCLYCDGG